MHFKNRRTLEIYQLSIKELDLFEKESSFIFLVKYVRFVFQKVHIPPFYLTFRMEISGWKIMFYFVIETMAPKLHTETYFSKFWTEKLICYIFLGQNHILTLSSRNASDHHMSNRHHLSYQQTKCMFKYTE